MHTRKAPPPPLIHPQACTHTTTPTPTSIAWLCGELHTHVHTHTRTHTHTHSRTHTHAHTHAHTQAHL